MKKRTKFVRIMAIIGVALLVLMYLTALVMALFDNEFARTMLKISFVGTITVPIVIYFIMMFYKMGHKNDDMNEGDNSK